MSDPSNDAKAACEFLLWARKEGFSFESVKVGSIELVGTRDLDPRPDLLLRAAGQDRGEATPSIYETYGGDIPGADEALGMRRRS